MSTRVENILHFVYIHRKKIDGYHKGFQKIVFKVMKNIKKDIMGVKILMFEYVKIKSDI